jgi:hypothetical protein
MAFAMGAQAEGHFWTLGQDGPRLHLGGVIGRVGGRVSLGPHRPMCPPVIGLSQFGRKLSGGLASSNNQFAPQRSMDAHLIVAIEVGITGIRINRSNASRLCSLRIAENANSKQILK